MIIALFNTIMFGMMLNMMIQQGNWDVQVHVLNSHVIPAEPIYVSIETANHQSVALKHLDYGINQFKIDDKECNPDVTGSIDADISNPAKKSDPDPIIYGLRQSGFEENQIVHINLICSIRWDNSKFPLGKHEFCYHWAENSKACDAFYFEEAKGTEAQALELLQQIAKKNYFLDVTEGAFQPVLKNYPDSRYSAWITYQKINNPTSKAPEKAVELIKKGIYPYENSVPDGDSPKGWKSIKKGKPMATWGKEKALQILKNFPDFIFAERLKLAIAINNLVLSNEAEGIKQLEDLVRNATIKASSSGKSISKDAQWAKQFMDLWLSKKIQ